MIFHTIQLPGGGNAILPDDISLEFPADSSLNPRQRCATAYIPWGNKYLELVPEEYRDLFERVLPQLGQRTTNVHTAVSVGQLPYLLPKDIKMTAKHKVYIATILHDIGWSKVSLRGIADSLSYSGVKPTSDAAQLPKEQHALIGVALAYDILDDYKFDGTEAVPETVKRQIAQIIRQHDYDAVWNKGRFGELSLETKLVCDADRLWSYSHENFWQDTVRKNVKAAEYLLTIIGAIDSYFITPQGKARANQLARERQSEVSQLAKLQ